ncbi:pyridoxal-phosphate dependent enzyme [Streptomyces sp. TRM64462]|uniref:1-aminocyclopropane-1-carboxylate deaminase/D-cysteine desulfhydrase n=1 Tax=Streptomyces sp. TRM64462 TaxID=2741726 RepID=UPI002815B442|nr:pyridoxal-phosphate dependent enzyme [Streptomyces sp. TRM64462]
MNAHDAADAATGTAGTPEPLEPRLPSPLEPVDDDRFVRRGLRLLLKRDDLIHPDLVGNKWRKLAPNLAGAAGRPVLTFGGAYSNHLRATAAAGRLLGFPTTGVVRGDELAGRPLNPSLARCAADGMRLVFVDRATYRAKGDPEVLARLRRDAPEGTVVVPEGGSNAAAVRGCAELGRELRGRADVVAVACGTGGTLAGLAAGLGPGRRAVGFPALKGGFLAAEIRDLQERAFGGPAGSWSLEERFHFGGFARSTPELEAFAEDFGARHGFAVERVYVAKMLYGLVALAEEGAFPPGTSVAAVITGRPEPGAAAGAGGADGNEEGAETVRPHDGWVRQPSAGSSGLDAADP